MNIIKSIKARVTKWTDTSSGRSLFVPRRSAGVVVNHDSAMTFSAIWRAVNLISGTIATLPWSMNQRELQGNGDVKHTRLFTHHASNILSLQANDEMSAQAWRETMLLWALTWGNGYSEIERDRSNRPVALWPLAPDRVTVDRNEDGEIIYRVRNNGRADTILAANNVFHLHGPGFDGLVGYSVIGYAARTVGLGLATEQFGSAFFENGAAFSGVFEHPDALGEDAINHLRESLQDAHGGPYNAGKPLILEEGMKFTSVSIPPQDAQYIETRKFTVIEVARWYGVPPHKLMEMEKSTFNNIEHQSIEFVNDALMPWIIRLEMEANIKLVSPQARSRMYTKLNVNGLLRGDLKARGEWYKTMMTLGVYNINEVRALEDENSIGKDGEKRLVQMNQTTLENIGEKPKPAAPPPIPPEGEEDEQEEEEEEASPQQKVLIDTVARIQRREMHRAKDALKRYDGDRDGLLSWMNNFYDEHERYMQRNLELPAQAVSMQADVDSYIQHHIQDARLAILKAFDDAEIEPRFTQADKAATTLIGRTL